MVMFIKKYLKNLVIFAAFSVVLVVLLRVDVFSLDGVETVKEPVSAVITPLPPIIPASTSASDSEATKDSVQYYFEGASNEIILKESTISKFDNEFLYGTYYDLVYNLEKVHYYVPYELNEDTSVIVFAPGSSNLPRYSPEVQYIKTHNINSIVIYRFSGSLTSVNKCANNFVKMINDIRYTYGVKKTDITTIGFSQGSGFALALILAMNTNYPESDPCRLILLDATLVCNGGSGRFLKNDEINALQENNTLVLFFEPKMFSKTKFHDYFPMNSIETYLILRGGTHREISTNAFEYGLLPWIDGSIEQLMTDDEPYVYYEFDTMSNNWIEIDGNQILK